VGRKIGFTNAGIWPTYGVYAPIWGHMYAHTLVVLAGTHARCRLGRFAEPRIEPEIALRLCRTPVPGAGTAALLACVDQVAHAFEIVQSHFAHWRFQAADTVADGGLHGALLLGPPQPVASLGADPARALQELTITLWRDGLRIEAGRGAHALGSPLAALAHLVAVLARQPQAAPLAAGEWITTGTVTAAYAVAPGQRWHTTVHGPALPGLEVAFRA
jgi:2-oxo-3-hexenedioate decarboxylase